MLGGGGMWSDDERKCVNRRFPREQLREDGSRGLVLMELASVRYYAARTQKPPVTRGNIAPSYDIPESPAR